MKKSIGLRQKHSITKGIMRIIAMLLVFTLFMGGSGMTVLAEEVGAQVSEAVEELEKAEESLRDEENVEIVEESENASESESALEDEESVEGEENQSEGLIDEESSLEIDTDIVLQNSNENVIDSGKCGENLFWTLDKEGILTISGEGDMYVYDEEKEAPWAFYNNNHQINSLIIEHGVTNISAYSFVRGEFGGELIIPDSVTSIGDCAFMGCSHFEGDLIIPDSVTHIGDYAFSDCSGFDGKLKLSRNLNRIGESVFLACWSLCGEIVIPNGVTEIGEGAFMECTNLSGDLVIPDGVVSIGNHAFNHLKAQIAYIPKSVTMIGVDALGYIRTIYGEVGSFAETYAQYRNMTFVEWDRSVFKSGNGTEEEPYIISNREELIAFAETVKNGEDYAQKYLILSNDIYFNYLYDYHLWSDDYHPQYIWDGIDGFAGTFDGCGYSIYGIYMYSQKSNTGFFNVFNKLKKVIIKNVNFKNMYVSGKGNVGGIVGKADYVEIENCTVDGIIKGTEDKIGGFVGCSGSKGHQGTRIYDSINYANIAGSNYIGGIIGYSYIGNNIGIGAENVYGTEMLVLSGCVNHGEIAGAVDYVGGIAGFLERNMNCGGIIISKNSNLGKISGRNIVGGLMGYVYSWKGEEGVETDIEYCYNTGLVSGKNNVGGIIGKSEWDGGNFRVNNSYNVADITGTGNAVGGIIGSSNQGCAVNYSFNTGKIHATSNYNALIGTATCKGTNYAYINNSFYLTGSAPNSKNGNVKEVGVKKLSAEEMKSEMSFAKFDFEQVWKMSELHPIFIWQAENKSENSEIEELDIFIYQADYALKNSDVNSRILKVLNEETYCKFITDNITDSEAFLLEFMDSEMGLVYLKDINSLREYQIRREDLYFALVMTILKNASKEQISKNYLDAGNTADEVINLAKNSFEGIKLTTVIEDIPLETRNDYTKFVEKWIKESKKYDWEAEDKFFGEINDVITTAQTIEDFWDEYTNLIYVNELSDDIKDMICRWKEFVLETEGSDSYLYSALDRAEKCFEESKSEIFASVAGKYGARLYYDLLWDKTLDLIKESQPALAVAMLSFEAGLYGSNIIANTDSIVDTKMNCVMMNQIIISIDMLCRRSMGEYANNPTSSNAKMMLNAINLMYVAHAQDRVCAIEFEKASSFPWESTQEAINRLEAEKTLIESYAENFEILWIGNLLKTHPDSGLSEKYSEKLKILKMKREKTYSFACPVNVRIVCGNKESFIKNGVLHAEEGVSICLLGDKKIVYLMTDEEYKIYLEGTDVGEMTVSIKSYDKNRMAEVYKEYRNVPLSTETIYTMNASNILKDEYHDVLMNGDEISEYVSTEPKYQVSIVNGSIWTERLERTTNISLARGEKAFICAENIVGYEFVEWTSTGDILFEEKNSANTYITVGTQDVEIIANYQKVSETYTISAKANVGGAIYQVGDITLCEGEDKTFYIAPEEGYSIYCVLVDGENIGKVERYSFEDVAENHTIVSSFIKKEEEEQDGIFPDDVPDDGIIPDGIWVSGIKDLDYIGHAQKQSFRVYDGYELLRENVDYTLSYKNNKVAYDYKEEDYLKYENSKIATGTFNPQKAPQIILKMKGNYCGNKKIYYRINPVNITSKMFSIDNLTVTYSGKKQTPIPNLTWNGKVLKYGTDYYIPEYDAAKKDKKAFIEKATYDLTIIGKNNFVGTLPFTLTISESEKQIAMNKVTVKGITSMAWTGEPLKPSGFSVKYKNDVLTLENNDYTITWGENKAVGIGKIIFNGTGLDSDGDGLSYIGSKVVTFKITGTSMSKVTVNGIEKSYAYSGNTIEPIGILTYAANKNSQPISLIQDMHYSVKYSKNLEKGIATIIYSGLAEGGYTGTKKVTFKIAARDISDIEKDGEKQEQIKVTFKDSANVQDGIYMAPFMKGGAKPEVMVECKEVQLVEGKDYTISYANNRKITLTTDTKNPTITIKGKGNYAGNKKVTFAINAKPLTNENGIRIVAKDKIIKQSKNGYFQKFKVYDADGKALGSTDYDVKSATYTLIQIQNEDGTVQAENKILDKNSIVPANSVIRITVTGKGNYIGGEASGTYRILENNHDISKATIQIKNQKYTGNPVLISEQGQFVEGKVYITIDNKKKVLELGKDIEVVPGSYIKNVNKGTAKVTFRGINDYGGTKTISYKIGARSINDIWQGIYMRINEWFITDASGNSELLG